MDFDIVIATRNRLLALQLSIPLMLVQNRLPKKLIIVDASDDSQTVEESVRATFNEHKSAVILEFHRSPRGLCCQRNLGLSRVESPVVFFPDDDAIWFPGFSEAIMQIYERDTECAIAAVCGGDSPNPPPGFFTGKGQAYQVARRDRSRIIEPLLNSLEQRFLRDPFSCVGENKLRRFRSPEWLPELDAVTCEWMTGFRMTFRTAVIRRELFDEVLSGYALFEDRDASLGVLNHGLIVCALRAQVYHHRSPERRTSGYEWGVIQVLNRAYIICKHTDLGDRQRERLLGHSLYRLGRYVLQAYSAHARERIKGGRLALRHLANLIKAPKDQLAQAYLTATSNCFNFMSKQ